MTEKSQPGLGGALREALAKRAEELHIRMNYSGMPDDKPYSDCPHFTFERCTSKACREARALLSLSSPIEPEPVIRCRDCGGTLMWAKTVDGYEVIHSCKDGKQVREMFAGAQASSEIREVIESIAQEMCALATEKHHSADGYAYEKLGKYGKRILEALAPSRQGAAKRVAG